MKLSEYPKSRLSYSQIDDEEKLKKLRKKNNVKVVCPMCGNDKFFITSMGLELCNNRDCYHCINVIF